MTEPLKRVHLDLCGPTDQALHGERYVAIFWDEATGYIKAVCLRRNIPEEVKVAFVKAFGNEKLKVWI